MVVYGKHWFYAQDLVRQGILDGKLEGLSPDMWRKVYKKKRKPEIPYDQFVLHELRKWNRGQIEGTYFDILFTRSYDDLKSVPAGRGTVIGRIEIEAKVTNASLAFDSPAVYEIEHESVSRVTSFTHTYSGQALTGETIEDRYQFQDGQQALHSRSHLIPGICQDDRIPVYRQGSGRIR